MKYQKILFLLLALHITACATTPGFFETDPLPKDGKYSAPENNILVQVQGDIISPYDYICRLNVNRRKGYLWGSNAVSSGALLKDGILITAGHNVYSPWYNQAKGIRIECGVGSKRNQTPKYEELNLSIENQIYVSSKYNWKLFSEAFSEDIAFVKICDSKGNAPNSTPFRIATNKELNNISEGSEIYISGYPADAPYTGSLLVHLKTTIKEKGKGLINYLFTDTYAGMSGSPIWYVDNGERIIIGVHVKGGGGGYLLSEMVIDEFSNWKNGFNNSNPCD